MQHHFDLIVLGGGIYGACVLRDAAMRGLSAVLIEQGDFGCETSHNSNKIIHSGIRYLQNADLSRVFECIGEARNWLNIAPHIVRPMPFVVPSYGRDILHKEILGAGVKVHDCMKRLAGCGLPPGGFLSKAETLDRFPMLDPEGLRGGALWYDAQLIDANRLIYECIWDAVRRGGVAMNYKKAVTLLEEGNRVCGVRISDVETGAETDLRSRVVVNATGPWLGALMPEAVTRRYGLDQHFLGMNLVIQQVFASGGLAMYGPGEDPRATKRRLYFLTPWKECSIIGTSHTYFRGHPENAAVSDEAIENLVNAANGAFPFLNLEASQVRYVYQGLTPASAEKQSITRSTRFEIIDHDTADGLAGLISVKGVKLTSARFIAERALDLVETKMGRKPTTCRTAEEVIPNSFGVTGLGEDSDPIERCLEPVRAGCVHSLAHLLTCRSELAEKGQVGQRELQAVARRMSELRCWSDSRREAETENARARLRLWKEQGETL